MKNKFSYTRNQQFHIAVAAIIIAKEFRCAYEIKIKNPFSETSKMIKEFQLIIKTMQNEYPWLKINKIKLQYHCDQIRKERIDNFFALTDL